jgi:hypothetical protein
MSIVKFHDDQVSDQLFDEKYVEMFQVTTWSWVPDFTTTVPEYDYSLYFGRLSGKHILPYLNRQDFDKIYVEKLVSQGATKKRTIKELKNVILKEFYLQVLLKDTRIVKEVAVFIILPFLLC